MSLITGNACLKRFELDFSKKGEKQNGEFREWHQAPRKSAFILEEGSFGSRSGGREHRASGEWVIGLRPRARE
jgi:hypothetical protein